MGTTFGKGFALIRSRLRGVHKGAIDVFYLGQVDDVSNESKLVSVHLYPSDMDQRRLMVKWYPVFASGPSGAADLTQPTLGAVPFRDILGVVQLNCGALNHSSTRRLVGMKLRADVSYKPNGSRVLGGIPPKPPALDSDTRFSALLSACGGDLASLVKFNGDSLQQWGLRAASACSWKPFGDRGSSQSRSPPSLYPSLRE